MKKIDSIKSNKVRAIALFLLDQGYSVTFFGEAWSNHKVNWIYFDTVLDIDSLLNQFDKNWDLEMHENTDHKSGLEKGLVDQTTGEAVMGLVC